ncbi:MAG: caspase family protein [Hyphomonas sp.]
MRLLLAVGIFWQLTLNFAAAQTIIPATPEDYTIYNSSRALLIGVTDYDDFEWADLHPIEGKVIELDEFLRSQGFTTEVVLNPSSSELKAKLRNFVLTEPEDSRSIIYFGGHGHTFKRDYGRISYITASDVPYPVSKMQETDEQRNERELKFRELALSTDEMESIARSSRGRHTLFLLESCFSAGMFHTMNAPGASTLLARPSVDILESRVKPPAFQFITAGGPKDELHSLNPFVDIVIAGMKGAADLMRKGYFTADELGFYTKQMIYHYPDERFKASADAGYMGLPNEDWKGRGDMVFLVPNAATPEVKPPASGLGKPISYRDRSPFTSAPPIWTTPADYWIVGGRINSPDASPSPTLQTAEFRVSGTSPSGIYLDALSEPWLTKKVQAEISQEREIAQETEEAPEVDLDALRDQVMRRESDILGEYNIYERFTNTDIRYYKKALDEGAVEDALTREGIPYRARPAQLNQLTTNALSCHAEAYDLDVFKAIGVSLIRNGVKIRLIKSFKQLADQKRNRIEILSVAAAWNYPPLTEQDILQLEECPKEFHK